MNNLYIVESPLQALCALEVSLNKKDEINSIIVKLSDDKRDKNNQQTLKVVDLGVWSKKVVLSPSNKRNNVINNHVNQLTQLSRIKKMFGSKIDFLYIGEFRCQFMHMVRCAVNAPNVYLLDDGAATINIIKNYINKKKYYPEDSPALPSKSYSVKKILYKILYNTYIKKSILEKEIIVLTAFSEGSTNPNIEMLTFKNISLLKNKKQKKDNSIIYYYGSYYSEKDYVSLDYEIKFLTEIVDFYHKDNKKVIYFAHRDESEKKLKLLSQNINLEIQRPTEIAELYLLKAFVFPGEVAGAYTSTLNNVKSILPEVLVRSFILDYNEIHSEKREAIQEIYNYYQKIGIKLESVVTK